MTLLTDAQMASIRGYGKLGMVTTITITRALPVDYADDSNPFGSPEPGEQTYTTTVKGWVLGVMERDFDEDGNRIVAIHDLTIRVPVGTVIEARDTCVIDGQTWTVVETNTEYTWPEWTVAYVKHVA
jgi:hypothetical protein